MLCVNCQVWGTELHSIDRKPMAEHQGRDWKCRKPNTFLRKSWSCKLSNYDFCQQRALFLEMNHIYIHTWNHGKELPLIRPRENIHFVTFNFTKQIQTEHLFAISVSNSLITDNAYLQERVIKILLMNHVLW